MFLVRSNVPRCLPALSQVARTYGRQTAAAGWRQQQAGRQWAKAATQWSAVCSTRWSSSAAAETAMSQEAMAVRAEELLQEGKELLAKDEFSTAESRLVAAVNLMEQMGGEQSSDGALGLPLLCLAYAEHCAGKLETAETRYRRVVDIFRGDDSQKANLSAALTNLADLLSHREDVAGAEETVREALPLLEEQHGEGEMVAAALQNLGTYLAVQNRFEDARQPMEKALAMFETHLGQHSAYTKGCLRTLLRLLEDLGETEEREKLQQRYDTTDASEEAEALDMTQVNEQLAEKMTAIWNQDEAKKTLDPSGAMSLPPILQEQYTAFEQRWGKDEKRGQELQAGDEERMKQFQKEAADLNAVFEAATPKVDVPEDKERAEKLQAALADVKDGEEIEENPAIQKMAEEELLGFARQFEGRHEIDLDLESLGFKEELLQQSSLSSSSSSKEGSESAEADKEK